MSVNSITNANNVVLQPKGGQQMGQSDFLRLMTAQLSHQDPFNPIDNQQMVAQMAHEKPFGEVAMKRLRHELVSSCLVKHHFHLFCSCFSRIASCFDRIRSFFIFSSNRLVL